MSYLIHQKILRQSPQVFQNVTLVVSLNDCTDPLIRCQVLSPFCRRLISPNELFVHEIPPFLDCTDSVDKFPKIWMIHTKFGLHSSMGCFSIIVCTSLFIQCPFVDRPGLRRKQWTTTGSVAI